MKNKGVITMWVLVFGTVFLIILSGTVGFLVFQIKQNQKTEAYSAAFHIAEAGINYARWHLAHAENDFNFSGTYDYKDPEGKVVGKYTLTITPPTRCDPGITVESQGWKEGFESIVRKLKIKYAKPALAKYAFLTNSNVWFGTDEELKGPFHSNGGIRMDGTQNSLSTSAKETYICGPEHGCSQWSCNSPCSWTSSGCECPGIWGVGEGGSKGLWQFPSSNVDFEAIIKDLSEIKQDAQNYGIYLPPSGRYGYHIIFKSNGTFDVYKVTRLQGKVWGYDGEKWVYESNSIKKETFYQSYTLPSDCSPVFVEDNLWVEGDVKGRVTVAAARLPDIPGNEAKIIIPNSINYVDNNSVLGLIAQKDILIPLYSPNNLEIKAALLAQKGHIFRYYYPRWWFEPYRTYALRDYIETYGSIITNTIWTFTWVDSNNNVVSGYRQTEMSYNSDLTYNPPPYFPVTGDYEIVLWEEVE
jgi:hypothetical protein